MEEQNKDLEYYLSLPYTIEVIRDNDEENPGWVARVVELPGCITQGDTFEELGEMIEDAMRGWIEIAIEDGIPVPEPRPHEEYSGKFVVRVPRSLHRELVEAAEKDDVSLNMFISTALGKAVGRKSDEVKKAKAVEPLPAVDWPRLGEQARRILLVNGMAEDVQQVDEKLFSTWIEGHLIQIKAAIESGYYPDALRYIQKVRQSLEFFGNQSPLIITYCQVVCILEDQVILYEKLISGPLQQNILQQRIRAQVQIRSASIEDEVSMDQTREAIVKQFFSKG